MNSMKPKSNSGGEKAPQPKSVTMFKGIQGLTGSGAGTKKTAAVSKVRPEQNEGKKIASPPSTSAPKKGQALTQTGAGAPKKIMGGTVSVAPGINTEPGIKRDSASVVKPFKDTK